MIFVGGVEGVFDKQDRYRDARLSGVIFDWARIGAELRWVREHYARIDETVVATKFGVGVAYIRALEDGRFDFVRSECGVRYAAFLRKLCPMKFDICCKEAGRMLDSVGG